MKSAFLRSGTRFTTFAIHSAISRAQQAESIRTLLVTQRRKSKGLSGSDDLILLFLEVF